MKIGAIDIEQPLLLAPMEDVSDTAFRIVCKRLGADVVYTEFTCSEALIRRIPKAIQKIRITEEERPIGIQLFGGMEESMEKAARMAEWLGPDFIDINAGCWVKKLVAHGQGAALLKDLPRLERIIRSTVQATRLPVTVKTRLGWDAQSIVILDVAKIAEQAGAKALAIHCRTRSQAHGGDADWHWLERVKKAVSIPVIGNGGATMPEDVQRMFETGCDGVMIGRGAVSNPWIFQQAKHYLKTGQHLPSPPLKEKIDLCIEHLKLAVHYRGLRDGIIPFRKYYMGYLKGIPHIGRLREDLMGLADLNKIIERLYQFLEQHAALEVNYA